MPDADIRNGRSQARNAQNPPHNTWQYCRLTHSEPSKPFWVTDAMDNFPKPTSFPRPLDGVTVLDMTVALAGPFATLLLAGLGARVIKIENPAAGDTCRSNAPYLGKNGATLNRENEDDISISALNRLRNKLGVTLNLKAPEAREVFADLVRNADVVVENFSRGTLDRLGVGYAYAREINPRIIYCSINGFRQRRRSRFRKSDGRYYSSAEWSDAGVG